jgi:hypothetical protein
MYISKIGRVICSALSSKTPFILLIYKSARDHWGDPGVDGRIILRRIFRKWDVGVWTGSMWLRIGTVGGHL